MQTNIGVASPHRSPDLRELEVYLGASLRPVKPRPEFISSARRKLADPQPTGIHLPKSVQFTLFAFLGVLSSLVILIAGIRAIITLIQAMHMGRNLQHQAE